MKSTKPSLKINGNGQLVEYNAHLHRWELTSRAWTWQDIDDEFYEESWLNYHRGETILIGKNHATGAITDILIWGQNIHNETLKEGDKISCGNGHDTWFTHVQFDRETNNWHREQDYSTGKKCGEYVN